MQSRSRVDRGKHPTSKAMRKKMVGIPSPAAASCLTAHQILSYCHNIIHPPAGSTLHHGVDRPERTGDFVDFTPPAGGGREREGSAKALVFLFGLGKENHDFSAQQEGRGGARKDLRLYDRRPRPLRPVSVCLSCPGLARPAASSFTPPPGQTHRPGKLPKPSSISSHPTRQQVLTMRVLRSRRTSRP